MATPAQVFQQWLDLGEPGSALIYHTGNLAADRVVMARDGATTLFLPVPEIDEVGKMALSAAERGECLLVQRGKEQGVYEYIAIKPKGATAEGMGHG